MAAWCASKLECSPFPRSNVDYSRRNKPSLKQVRICCETKPQDRFRRNVHFSERSNIKLYDQPEQDIEQMWYSVNDKKRFRSERISDAKRMMQAIAASESGSLAPEERMEFVGLESFLWRPETIREKQMKAVLSAQKVQRMISYSGDKGLFCASVLHSRWSRQVANEIAVVNCDLELDGVS